MKGEACHQWLDELVEQVASARALDGDLSAVFQNAPMMMLVLDSEAKIRLVNRAVVSWTQRPASKLLAKPVGRALRCLHFLDDPRGCGYGEVCQRCTLRRGLLDGLREGVATSDQEVTLEQLPGEAEERCALLLSTTPITREGADALLVYLQDISEKRSYQQQLEQRNEQLAQALGRLEQSYQRTVQQERLAAVGQLAAGIAHEFNNLLTGILGAADLLQIDSEISQEGYAHANMVSEAGRRAAHLVQQIVDFSRKSMRQAQVFDLRPLLKESVKFLQRTLSERVQVTLELGPEPYWIEADSSQLHQLFVNLALNARDAIEGSGEFRISLSSVELVDELACDACGSTVEAGRWVLLQLSDTGAGMTDDVLRQIFDPFFTTKETGQGSGLGLSQVLGIVGQQNGHITVKSSPGAGSTFSIFLPPADPLKPAASSSRGRVVKGKGQTVIVVEDEETARRACVRMLQRVGYRVFEAKSAQEALAHFEAEGDTIDLMLTDLVMPDMGGDGLYYQLKERYPALRVIFMSGYPLHAGGLELVERQSIRWVKKPLSLGALAEAVASALE